MNGWILLWWEKRRIIVNSFGADKLLAVIIYEMTFCGFTEEDHQKEIQKLREAIAETESIQSRCV